MSSKPKSAFIIKQIEGLKKSRNLRGVLDTKLKKRNWG